MAPPGPLHPASDDSTVAVAARDTPAMADTTAPLPHDESYANGNPKMTGFHLDGEMHGDWAFYRLDGSVMRTGSFDRGRQVGVWKTYDRSGQVLKETTFGEIAR